VAGPGVAIQGRKIGDDRGAERIQMMVEGAGGIEAGLAGHGEGYGRTSRQRTQRLALRPALWTPPSVERSFECAGSEGIL